MTTIVSSSLLLAEKPSISSIDNHYLANDVLTTFPDQPILNGLDRVLYSLGITDIGLGTENKDILDIFIRSKEKTPISNISSSESHEFHSSGEMMDKPPSGIERERKQNKNVEDLSKLANLF